MWPDEGNVVAERSNNQLTLPDNAVVGHGNRGIANLTISNSTKTHIGDNVYKVNVTSPEGIKGRFLGLDVVSISDVRKLRCSVAVFLCWTILITTVLLVFLLKYALLINARLDIGIQQPWFLRREDWQARSEYKKDYLKLPVKNVVIGHTATPYCDTRYTCIRNVLAIQQDHLDLRLVDIGPNYLVGGNGFIFEGRGANVLSEMVIGWNDISITIMFIGNYVHSDPDQAQLDNVNFLLKTLVEKNVLVEDYLLYGKCQLIPYIISPGRNIMENLHNFTHFNPVNTSQCLSKDPQDKYRQSMSNPKLPFHRFVWVHVKEANRTEKIACSAALLALFIIILIIIYFTCITKNTNLDKAPHDWNITREMWLAQPPKSIQRTQSVYEPLHIVVIHHTTGDQCHSFVTCAAALRKLQDYHQINLSWDDIGYNFIVGNDGRIYEGRGWRVVGAHTEKYNMCTLGIGFIGDYKIAGVSKTMIDNTMRMLEDGVLRKFLHPNYVVVGGRDLKPTASPGDNLYNEIKTWTHYDQKNQFYNKTCMQILSMAQN